MTAQRLAGRSARRKDHLRAIATHGRIIAEAVEKDPDRPVPTCPEWRLRDLGLHVAVVANMWAENVRRRATDPPPHGLERPEDRHVGELVQTQVGNLVDVLRHAREDAPAWNWWGDPTARGIPRRAAHETGVHAWDATNALGEPIVLDADLAADGIVEFFDVMMPFTGHPPTGIEGTLGLTSTEPDATWLVDITEDSLPTIRVGGKAADVTLRGSAADVYLVLWRRRPLSALAVAGERRLAEQFLTYPRLG